MKRTKKCENTQNKISKTIKNLITKKKCNRRYCSAGPFNTSSAGAIMSLIVLLALSINIANISINHNNTYAYDISMTSSGAQSIDVAPSSSGSNGTSIASDAISITTTCPAGYNLSMSTSVDDNKLYLGGTSSSSSYFSPANGTTALKDASNTWGYYFNNSSSTAPTSSSVFSAIPALGNTATIKNSSSTSDSFSVYYGVSASSGLTPGNYKMKQDGSNANGTVVYYLTMDETCGTKYMQNMTKSDLAELMPNEGDSTVLVDKRDEKSYQVTKINNNYWMTQNLRITGTISSELSNFTGDDVNISAGDLTSGNSYNQTRTHVGVDSAGNDTVWYNYCSVSAGTVCSQTQVDATNDICPAGWKLPTQSDVNDIISYKDTFAPIAGGVYTNGSISNADRGFWWTTTASSGTNTYQLRFMSNALSVNNTAKTRGEYVRCIKGAYPKPSISLYDLVAEQSKGTQTKADLQAKITTANSGVYEYNTSVFGNATDGGSDHTIYYYRGILDNTTGSYGSNGDNAAYPNTVVLSTVSSKSGLTTSDTCWRIVRTTGSGGTKMIYQGKWTGSTCANAQTGAQTTTKAFDTTADGVSKSIVGVGYTHNSDYRYTTTSTQAGTLFGKDSSYSGNTANSTMKSYLEGTGSSNFWDTISSYESKLEPSAGYCNDRSVNSGESWTTYSDTTSITKPYSSSSATSFFFGAYQRNRSTYQTPTLGCPRSTVDLYTTSSASNGNKQLSKPVALLTADEASFAGSGSTTASQGSSYDANSFLRSGSDFWLLSPSYRSSYGDAGVFVLVSSGYLYDGTVGGDPRGVRPVISLTSGTTPVSGSGTATDPWIVNLLTMQSATAESLAAAMPNVGDTTTLRDERDDEEYLIGKLADGNYWMLDNLRLGGSSTMSLTPADTNITSNFTLPASTTSGFTDDTTGYTQPAVNADYKNTTTTSYGAGSGKIGNYYNYCSASAGTYCYPKDEGTENAEHDICPAGWRMPTGGSSGEYNALATAYNNNYTATNSGSLQYNLSTPLSGYFYNGSAYSQGSYGFFWSSTYRSGDYMYYLNVNSSNVTPTGNDYRYSGNSLRCILDS